jgi:hypothetical protein
MIDGLTVTSLSASLQHKTRVTKDHAGEIASNRKLLHIIYAKLCYTENYHVNSKSGVNCHVTLKQNQGKRTYVKTDLPVL